MMITIAITILALNVITEIWVRPSAANADGCGAAGPRKTAGRRPEKGVGSEAERPDAGLRQPPPRG